MKQFLLVLALTVPALATLFLALRVSAFRKDRADPPTYFARPYTTFRELYRDENYFEEGRHLLDWLAAATAVTAFAMFFVLALA
jgi:hypothetical protein